VIATTTPEIVGKTIIEYKGIVFGEVLGRATNMGWTKASIINEFENVMVNSKNEALNKLINRAMQIGANAVVGISFDFNYAGASMSISATGTAVVVS